MQSALNGLMVAVLLAWAASAPAAGWSIAGRVVDESGQPVGGAVVETDGARIAADQNGGFRVDVETRELVRLRIAADGYYETVHALHRSDAVSGVVDDFVVELVARAPERRLLLFAGDVMLARRFFEPRAGEPALVRRGHVLEDGQALLATIQPYVELADYASVNVETQLSADRLTNRLPKSVTFYSPPELATILRRAGFDYSALGNNHTWDYRAPGLTATLAALDGAGLDRSGAGLDEVAARRACAVELGDQPYRFLSYVGWAGTFSPTQAASGSKGGAALGDSEVFAEDLGRVDAGTVAVLQFHSGIEYSESPALSVRTSLRDAVDRGADLVVGHHPHVIQGLEIYRDRLIAYSMGNFLFDQYHYTTQLGMLVYAWMDGDSLHRAEVVPLNINGYVPTPATGRFRAAVLTRLARLSRPLGTCLRRNGAHAVIEHCSGGPDDDRVLADIGDAEPATIPLPLAAMGMAATSPVAFRAPGYRYRLGIDLLRRGDFESEGLYGTRDRAFLRGDRVRFEESGSRALRIDVPAGEDVRTGMKVFERVFSRSNPTTVSGRVRADADLTMEFRLQRRRDDDGLEDALKNGPARLVGRLHVSAGEWRSFSFDFDQPRVSTRSVRLLIDVRNEAGKRGIATAWLDDLSWVEWNTPWLDGDGAAPEGGFATHVQFAPHPAD